VQARFTEFETAGLAKLLPAFAAHDYFDQALWDDVADSITYCNHYMAPSRIPLPDVAALFSAYAKYEVRTALPGVPASCGWRPAL
jgi:protein phosphatase 1 regulatory subunit 42